MHLTHALATSTCRGFDEQGKTNASRFVHQYLIILALAVVTGNRRSTNRLCQLLGCNLRSHQAHSGSGWTNKDNASLLTCFDKSRILGKETITRMNGLCSTFFRNVDDSIDT